MTKERMTLKLDFPWIMNSFVAFLVNGGVYTYIWPRVWQWLIETNWHLTGPPSLMGLPAQALLRADSAHTPFQTVVSAFHKVFTPLFLPRAPQLYGKNRYLNPHNSQLVLLSPFRHQALALLPKPRAVFRAQVKLARAKLRTVVSPDVCCFYFLK